MNSGYKIFTTNDSVDKLCNIVYQAGKGAVGCSFHKGNESEIYVWGKFSDMVRVWSAMKRNNYSVRMERDK